VDVAEVGLVFALHLHLGRYIYISQSLPACAGSIVGKHETRHTGSSQSADPQAAKT
jgi:hypothetical protein